MISHAKEPLLPPWPVFESCKEQGVPVTLFFVFATDSGNLGPAHLLANAASMHLGLDLHKAPLIAPKSWASLYGSVRA